MRKVHILVTTRALLLENIHPDASARLVKEGYQVDTLPRALGEDEVKGAKLAYGWPEDAQFLVPEGVPEHFQAGVGARGRDLRAAWETKFEDYRAEFPELANQLDRILRPILLENRDPQQVQHLRIVRIHRQQLSINRLCLRHLALGMQPGCLLE